ncbi:MAG: Polyphenol oxidase [Chlamydiae bacterium]|nr:Polyphenol oxidase [Chlamydiota bacterium]
MLLKTRNEITFLEFELLKDFKNLHHGVLCRKGGASDLQYKSLNLNVNPTCNPQDILQNFETVKQSFCLKNPVLAKQVHKNNITDITPKNRFEAFECDGFITSYPNIPILTKHADCQAALFYDPVKKVIANIHCGWRGNVINIYNKTIQKMKDDYKCNPSDIIVCISPSLGPKHAEFVHYQKEFPKSFWPFKNEMNYFDLWEISKDQLIKANVLEKNIEIAKICTYENSEDFFSYRRENKTGRNMTFIELTK